VAIPILVYVTTESIHYGLGNLGEILACCGCVLHRVIFCTESYNHYHTESESTQFALLSNSVWLNVLQIILKSKQIFSSSVSNEKFEARMKEEDDSSLFVCVLLFVLVLCKDMRTETSNKLVFYLTRFYGSIDKM